MFKKILKGTGEMSQWVRVFTVIQRTGVWVPVPTWGDSEQSVTSAPGDLTSPAP